MNMTNNGISNVILITGGAGFIGSNLAERLLEQPDTHVRVFDNLSRPGVTRNLDWLQSLPTSRRLEIVEGDIRDAAAVRDAARDASEIYHLAAQVAVTTSVDDPSTDFHVNALGTLNVLEAARRSGRKPFLLYTSTNKVYGGLESVPVRVEGTRYCAEESAFKGVNESELLDFHSPYGCSKGAADQYVRDYARIYDLPTVVFRMSCIAGPRQFGNEDQGWVAHFLYSVLAGRPVTVFGDGFQVRDVLHVYDLLDAIQAARRNLSRTRGRIYNLGGGLNRTVSVLEMLRLIERKAARPLDLHYRPTRPGDQPLYITDTTAIERDTGWHPRRSLAETLDAIHEFWWSNSEAIANPAATPELIAEEVA